MAEMPASPILPSHVQVLNDLVAAQQDSLLHVLQPISNRLGDAVTMQGNALMQVTGSLKDALKYKTRNQGKAIQHIGDQIIAPLQMRVDEQQVRLNPVLDRVGPVIGNYPVNQIDPHTGLPFAYLQQQASQQGIQQSFGGRSPPVGLPQGVHPGIGVLSSPQAGTGTTCVPQEPLTPQNGAEVGYPGSILTGFIVQFWNNPLWQNKAAVYSYNDGTGRAPHFVPVCAQPNFGGAPPPQTQPPLPKPVTAQCPAEIVVNVPPCPTQSPNADNADKGKSAKCDQCVKCDDIKDLPGYKVYQIPVDSKDADAAYIESPCGDAYWDDKASDFVPASIADELSANGWEDYTDDESIEVAAAQEQFNLNWENELDRLESQQLY